MLEYNFDLLDNDFITLWSNYLLYNDANAIIKPLRILAEKGQINAVQSWYLLKKEDEHSEKIDKIVESQLFIFLFMKGFKPKTCLIKVPS